MSLTRAFPVQFATERHGFNPSGSPIPARSLASPPSGIPGTGALRHTGYIVLCRQRRPAPRRL